MIFLYSSALAVVLWLLSLAIYYVAGDVHRLYAHVFRVKDWS